MPRCWPGRSAWSGARSRGVSRRGSAPAWPDGRTASPARSAGSPPTPAKIATGRSPIDPARRDRRYADRAWQDNPIFKGLAQGHAALAVAIDELLDTAELDPADDYRLRLIAINLIEALAPANWPMVEPGRLEGDHRHAAAAAS